MRRLTNFLFITGLLVITHGITRWYTIRQIAIADPAASEGDPRFMTAFQHMFVEVGIGIVLLSIAAYLFNRPNKKTSSQPPTQRTQNG